MEPYTPPSAYRNDPEYVAYLEQRIAALENRVGHTNLVSPKFWTRAWAVYGHHLAIGILFYVIILAIAMAFGLFGAVLSFLPSS